MSGYVTVFRGQRDRYQVPIALYEHGLLQSHVCEWYSPVDKAGVRRITSLQPRVGRFLNRRHHPDLPSSKVMLAPTALVKDAINLLSRQRRLFSIESVDASLGQYAGRLARQRNADILSYNYYAYHAFQALGKSSRQAKILFQCHPHPSTVRRILSRELELNPDCSASLLAEHEINPTSGAHFEQLATEPKMADFCIVTSSFAKRSLIENGVAAEYIAMIPYGVDLSTFHPGPRAEDDTFRVLFIGSAVQRKGIKYLLEAWKRLGLKKAELIVAGKGFVDEALLARYTGLFSHRPNLSIDWLVDYYQKADVFCLPSLAEGFGLVILEALACGTPVITTSHTAGADIIESGKAGFILEPGNVDQLVEQIQWCYNQRATKLAAMRPACRCTAENYPWPAFRQRLVDVVTSLTKRAA